MPASTPNLGFSYPLSTDPPNGAAQIQLLAGQVDTALKATNDAVALRALSSHSHDSTYAKGYVTQLSSGTDAGVSVTGNYSSFVAIGTAAMVSGRRYLINWGGVYGNNSASVALDDPCSGDAELFVNGSLLAEQRIYVAGSYDSQNVAFSDSVIYTAPLTGSIELKIRVQHVTSVGVSTLYSTKWSVIDVS